MKRRLTTAITELSKICLAGVLGFALAASINVNLPGTLEAAILGFTCYSMVGVLERLANVMAEQKKQTESKDRHRE